VTEREGGKARTSTQIRLQAAGVDCHGWWRRCGMSGMTFPGSKLSSQTKESCGHCGMLSREVRWPRWTDGTACFRFWLARDQGVKETSIFLTHVLTTCCWSVPVPVAPHEACWALTLHRCEFGAPVAYSSLLGGSYVICCLFPARSTLTAPGGPKGLDSRRILSSSS
jgi:hypothetical protein